MVWDKPSYPFNPHLTLYDGDDKAFANDLLDGLRSCFKPFSVTARGVDHIISVKGERALPTMRLSIELASKALGVSIQKDVSTQSHRDVRLKQIFRIYQSLQDHCNQVNSSPSSTNSYLLPVEKSHSCERSSERATYHVVDRKKVTFMSTAPEV